MSTPRRPSPTLRRAIRSRILEMSSSATGSTATSTEMAMQRSPAEPKPAFTAASAASVQIRVGKHDHVVLGTSESLHSLAVPACRTS